MATGAIAEQRRPLLGVLYDEVARKHWDDLSGKIGKQFICSTEMSVVRGDLLRSGMLHAVYMRGVGVFLVACRWARALHDALFAGVDRARGGQAASSARGEVDRHGAEARSQPQAGGHSKRKQPQEWSKQSKGAGGDPKKKRKRDMSKVRWYKCQGFGHFAADCKEK